MEKRIAYLEYTIKELHAKQQEDLDGLLRQIHNLPGKAKTDANPKKIRRKIPPLGKLRSRANLIPHRINRPVMLDVINNQA